MLVLSIVQRSGIVVGKPEADNTRDQSDLVQGTLEMLILKTLALEPCTATASRCASSRSAAVSFGSTPARCCPR